MDKKICLFLTGFIAGMIFSMVLSLKIIESRLNSLESPFASIGYELDSLTAEVRSLREPIQYYYDQAGTAREVMQDCIDIGRNEVNDYNRTFGEKIGKR